jgi:hypothetical protein
MKIPLVVDGSSHSSMATKMLEALCLPSGTEIMVMTVVPEQTFLGGITLSKLSGALAKEYNSDIIALGSRGLTRIESILLGGVAERVARYANCSVLIGRAAK